MKFGIVVIFVSIFISGCATQQADMAKENPVYITNKEFGSGIVKPTIDTLSSLSLFFKDKGHLPKNKAELVTYSLKSSESINWDAISKYEISEHNDTAYVSILIQSPSSMSNTGKIVTSWQFRILTNRSERTFNRISVVPGTYLCLKGERNFSDKVIDSFFELTISYLSKKPVSGKSNNLCFKPDTGMKSVRNKKIERMREKSRNKLREMMKE